MATIDPKVYYDTGKYLTDLGSRLGKANNDLIAGLSGCGGMAGNYDDAKKWSQSYGQSADEVIDNTRTLAETLGHFGSLVSWAGYNHDLANYNSNMSSSKGAPPTAPPPVPAPAVDACWVDSPSAFGGSGGGLQTNIPNLLGDIGIPVPDGDTALLDNAAAAWHAFITSDAVEDAMNLSLLGVFRFQHVDSPEVPDIQEHLGTLASCAVNIQDSGNRLRQACSDHSSGLTQLRKTLHDLLRDLDIQLGLTLAITIFTSFLSAGASSGAGGAAAATEITTTAARMATAIRDLNIVERISRAFADVKDLSLAKTKGLINAIRGLTKTSAEEEDIVPAEEAAANDSNLPGTQAYQQRHVELSQDPAKNGSISPASQREATVGLQVERDGAVPGPISRAPLDSSGKDQGEFIDSGGQNWDVKSSPDLRPSYGDRPGDPIPKPQSDAKFTAMINKELNQGTNVILDPDGMTPDRLARLQQIVNNNPDWSGKVVWAKP